PPFIRDNKSFVGRSILSCPTSAPDRPLRFQNWPCRVVLINEQIDRLFFLALGRFFTAHNPRGAARLYPTRARRDGDGRVNYRFGLECACGGPLDWVARSKKGEGRVTQSLNVGYPHNGR